MPGMPSSGQQMQFNRLMRREFMTLLSSALVAWPVAARTQQPALPLIGFLHDAFPKAATQSTAAFRQGLSESGYVARRNVAIEYQWAWGRLDQLPALAADLVARRVAVIVAATTPAARAARAATKTIPIVFATADNPVQLGLVANLNRPGGNLTGVIQTSAETTTKRLELLHELLPTAKIMALLVNPSNAGLADRETSAALAAAHRLGVELRTMHASDARELEAIYQKLPEMRTGGLVIGADILFRDYIQQVAAVTLQHSIPAASQWREFADAGGLLGYGSDVTQLYRLVGIYTGRILNGEKAADLPVRKATGLALSLNLKTAKALGISVPLSLSSGADEVIE
jgi:putative ABC transport system substrate-binding protein